MFTFWKRKPKVVQPETDAQREWREREEMRIARVNAACSGTWPPVRPPEEELAYQRQLQQKLGRQRLQRDFSGSDWHQCCSGIDEEGMPIGVGIGTILGLGDDGMLNAQVLGACMPGLASIDGHPNPYFDVSAIGGIHDYGDMFSHHDFFADSCGSFGNQDTFNDAFSDPFPTSMTDEPFKSSFDD
jgi:hypothetical protein